jgi:hypothetical protein
VTDTTATEQVEVARIREELQQSRRELAALRAEQEEWAEERAGLEYDQRQFIELTERLDQHFIETEGSPDTGRRRRLLFGSSARPASEREIADMARLRATPLFDGAWYLRENPGVAATGMSPALHYLRRGAKNGRNPGPNFDTSAYVARTIRLPRRANPLLHYVDSLEGAADRHGRS